MQCVSVAKLQNKLGGEANQNTVCKMIDKMAQVGFVEAKRNHRLGESRVQYFSISQFKKLCTSHTYAGSDYAQFLYSFTLKPGKV